MSLRNDDMINIYYIKATKLYLELATHAVPTFPVSILCLIYGKRGNPHFIN